MRVSYIKELITRTRYEKHQIFFSDCISECNHTTPFFNHNEVERKKKLKVEILPFTCYSAQISEGSRQTKCWRTIKGVYLFC